MMGDDYEWKPLKRLGRIEFGKELGDAIAHYRLSLLRQEEDDSMGWQVVYGNPDDSLQVCVESDVVAQVACYKRCIYDGRNLLGMPVNEALALLGCPECPSSDAIEIDGSLQNVFEIEFREAQLWEKDGFIVTVFCGPAIEE